MGVMNIRKDDYIAVYGSLLKELSHQECLKIGDNIKYIDKCKIKGELFDLGEYPGLVDGEGVVEGEVYKIIDYSVFKVLDEFEEFYPEDMEKSQYIRKCVKLHGSNKNAWLYFYNGDTDNLKKIKNGSWISYLNEKKRYETD